MAFQYGQQVDSNGTIIHTGFWGVGSIFSTVTLPQIIENFRAIGEDGAILAVHDASKVTSGIFDIARIPAAAIERMTSVVDQSTRYALTTASVQNGDCVLQLDTSIMYWVIDDTNLGNAAGYHQYNAGTAASVPWSGVTGKPATAAGYGIFSTDAMFGTILTGYDTIALRNLALGSYAPLATTLAGYGITDAYTKTTGDAKYALKGANSDITSLAGLTTPSR